MRVIAKAYDDEPIDRVVVASTPKLAYLVVGQDADDIVDDGVSGVGFPRAFVFEYDSRLMRALQTAWESGDRTRLHDLWQHCQKWQGSAN